MSQISQHDRADSTALKPLTVTVATAKKISGLGNTTVWGLIKQGKLEAVRVGRRTLVTFRSLEALLAPAHTGHGDEI
jgi:excisionase family DNA binding protein